MALAYHKWTYDTRLRLLNIGRGILEVTVSVKPDKNTTGKKITIQPQSDTYVRVRDLLPPFTDISKLNDDNLDLHIKNVGSEASNFNMFEHGPFTTTRPPVDSEDLNAQDILDYMDRVITEADFYSMENILKEVVTEENKKIKKYYGLFTFLQGRMANSLFRFPAADRYFEEAWNNLDDETKLWCCFEWSSALMNYMMLDTVSLTEKGKAIQKAIQILDRIPLLAKDNPFVSFELIATKFRKAFCLCYLGEAGEAQKMFDDETFPVISAEDYNNDLLNNFFKNIDYGFWVAIESGNGDLLKKISGMIACNNESFIKESSPIRSMRLAATVAHQKNRKGLGTAFSNLVKNGHHYAPEFINLREFIKLFTGKDEKALDNFIYFER